MRAGRWWVWENAEGPRAPGHVVVAPFLWLHISAHVVCSVSSFWVLWFCPNCKPCGRVCCLMSTTGYLLIIESFFLFIPVSRPSSLRRHCSCHENFCLRAEYGCTTLSLFVFVTASSLWQRILCRAKRSCTSLKFLVLVSA